MNQNATETRLREIAERENKATKGPWRFLKCGDKSRGAKWFMVAGEDGKECSVLPGIEALNDLPERPNSVFLAHSRQDVPWLLALENEHRWALKEIEHQLNKPTPNFDRARKIARDALNFSPENL